MSDLDVTILVEELHKTLGFPKPRQDHLILCEALMTGFDNLVAVMARQASLPCTFKVKLTRKYSKTNSSMKGVAWIYIPRNLPQFGDDALSSVTLNIYLNKQFLRSAPLEVIVFTLAHELAHVVLKCMRSPFAPSERATEVCAMMLGYEEMALRGYSYTELRTEVLPMAWWKRLFGARRDSITTIRRHTVGYLTRDEYHAAAEIIQFIRMLCALTART